MSDAGTVYQFTVSTLAGEPLKLERYRGQVLLIVNTASYCGFTPQYSALEALYQRFQERGLMVLGFPCNQFRQQEPGSAKDIAAFCETNYRISFPLFAKVDVNGKHTHPLFAFLKDAAPGVMGTKTIKWNFTKFLIRKDGTVHKRYAPYTKPERLEADIELLVQA